MDKGRCYTQKDFENYYGGKLSPEEDKEIDEHLNRCSNCAGRILSIKLKPIREILNGLEIIE